jgi:meso-butanediol dehydrogenase/(S,S)-butanediol dehydrogenase/diacetyl reductase
VTSTGRPDGQHLSNKIAIVTGASKGIGRSIALSFAKEGANVVIADVLDGRDTVSEVLKLGRAAIAMRTDVSKVSDTRAMAKRTVDEFGRIDMLVNSAGVLTRMRSLTELTEQDWDLTMDVNAKGVFLCCQAVAPYMIKQRYGKIINISSGAGKTGYGLLSHYCASKFAVNGLTQSVALDLASYGINVNAVCPGFVETDMGSRQWAWEAELRGASPEKIRADYLRSVPLGRLVRPEDIANVVVFLASEDSSSMTGQAINVTGGREMH